MQFAERIAAIRKSMKISQEKFGELVNVSQRTVAFWESGERLPSHTTFAELADKLNVSVDYLLGRTDEPRNTKKEQPAVQDGELRADVISRIQALPDAALCRVSDFLDGFQAGREVAAAGVAAPDPADAPGG